MTPPTRETTRIVPPYHMETGAGFTSQALGNGAPTYSGPYYQFRLGQSFDLDDSGRNQFFVNGVFRHAFLFTFENDTQMRMMHFGLEGGYEGWIIPDQMSAFLLGGIGTNVFYSPNINSETDPYALALNNSAALALTLGGGLSFGRGAFTLMGGFQPTFGLTADISEEGESPTRIGYNPIGWYAGIGIDLARLTAIGGGEFAGPDGERFLEGLSVGAMLDASYTYNFQNPSTGENALRIFDTRADRPMFNLAQFHLVRETEERVPFGFGVVFDVGENTAVSAAGDSFNGDYFDLQQIWGEVRLPIGNGLTFRGGKVATIIGNEVIEPVNNQISRSWAFGLGIPFTHGALLASYPIIDEDHQNLKMTLGVANGWDNLYGQNTGPTALYGLFHQPADWVHWSLTGALGADSGRVLSVVDGILAFTSGGFSTTFNVDWGHQGDAGAESPEANWVVASVSPRYDFHHHIGLSGRLEVFHDPQGVRTGLPQTLGHGALTLHVRPMPEDIFRYFPLELRGEIRHDLSDNVPFLDGSDPSDHQTTFAVSATINFENFRDLARDPE